MTRVFFQHNHTLHLLFVLLHVSTIQLEAFLERDVDMVDVLNLSDCLMWYVSGKRRFCK